MKRVILAFVMIAMAFISVNAADTSAAAKKILDKAASKISLKSGVQMGFTIKGSKINQSGTITVKGKKYNARTSSAIVWYDGKTQWTYLKKNEEVNVTTPNASKQAQMNPYAFLTLYKSGYTLSYEKVSSGNEVHLVSQGKKSIQEMYVLVDANSNIKQVKMKQGSGWTTINVTSVKSVKVSDSNFTFNAKDYPKAEVVDLR